MIARCPLCRAFVATVHAPDHHPRLGRHPDPEAARIATALGVDPERVAGQVGWCRYSGREAAPLMGYVAHPVAPPAVAGALSEETFEAATRIQSANWIDMAVAVNLANADRWYAGLLARFPHLDLVMPWRPMLDRMPDDGPTGPNRARGLRTATAAAARCDFVLALVKVTPGMSREAQACLATGGRLVSLEQLGPTCPDPGGWPSDDDLPPELRS